MIYKIIKNYPNHKIYENGDIINIKNVKLKCKDNRVGLCYDGKQRTHCQKKLLYENFYDVNLSPDENICLIDKNQPLHYTNIKIIPKGWINNQDELDPNKEWKFIKGYKSYKISNYGDIYSVSIGKILKLRLDEYYKINLYHKKSFKSFYVHRLVYDTFIGLTDKSLVIDHIDRDKINNYIGNLRETTVSENNANCIKPVRSKSQITQYNKNNELIKIWDSYDEILKNTNYKKTTLITCCLGKSKSAYGYIWKDLNRIDDNTNFHPIKTYDKHTYSKYYINTKGEVINHTNKVLRQHIKKGYYHIGLVSKEGLKICYSIHRLVAMTFIPNPDNLPLVNHIDKNKLNDDVSNLEWCTATDNNIHAQGKMINQIDIKTNKIINTYKSISTAEKLLNLKGISKACNGKSKTSGGYKWEFVKC